MPHPFRAHSALYACLQKARGLTLRCEKGNRLFVEGNENFPAKPVALVGNNAISKIPARFEHRQASLYGGSVHFHVCGGKQCADCGGCVGGLEAIDPKQHPHKFTQTGQRNRNQFGISQDLGVDTRLSGVATHDGTNKYIRVSTATFIFHQPNLGQSPHLFLQWWRLYWSGLQAIRQSRQSFRYAGLL